MCRARPTAAIESIHRRATIEAHAIRSVQYRISIARVLQEQFRADAQLRIGWQPPRRFADCTCGVIVSPASSNSAAGSRAPGLLRTANHAAIASVNRCTVSLSGLEVRTGRTWKSSSVQVTTSTATNIFLASLRHLQYNVQRTKVCQPSAGRFPIPPNTSHLPGAWSLPPTHTESTRLRGCRPQSNPIDCPSVSAT